MRLTPEHLAAARACGCALLPATEDQIRRFSPQRRVFRVDGAPFVATRGGGFFETWATLAALIEKHRPAAAERGTAADAVPGPEHVALSGPESSPAPAEPEAARAQRHDGEAPSDKPRRPRARRPRPPAPAADTAPADDGAMVGQSEAEDMLAGVAAAQASGAGARVMGRRRAGQPPTPRWMVAGKMRRGRLK